MTKMCRSVTGLLIAICTTRPPSAGAGTFTTIDPPGSTYTYAASINTAGAITGYYQDAGGHAHGFLRDSTGGYTIVDAPGSLHTFALSISNAGAVVGYYVAGGVTHGFLRDSSGAYTTVDAPGSLHTFALSISNAGAVVGYYVAGGVTHGFLRDSSGAYTTVDPPGSLYTTAVSVNAAGAITGYYVVAGGVTHGFLRDSGGAYTTVDPPGSAYTTPASINTAGAITGYYADGPGHGFLRDPGGAYTTVDFPGALYSQPAAINSAGAIAGYYQDSGGTIHGFLRNPVGAFTPFDPPGSLYTQPTSINAASAITGYYQDETAVHGFLFSPGDPLDAPYQVRYASNLTHGDSIVNITNTGANGASLFGPGFGAPAGNLCVNVYAFSPDEQLISCCSCPVTPNGLVNLTANRDLVSNTLTGIRPDSIVIKLVATATGKATTGEATYTGATCTGSAAFAGDQFPVAPFGLLAWGTTLHSASTVEPNPGPFSVSESQFLPATLSADELRSIASRCKNIIGNGSTFGICRSCRQGGLGGAKQ